MRSKLFVPGIRPELFPKAASSKADAISFDLEDAVAPERKGEARLAVASLLAEPFGKPAIVRVNSVSTTWFEDDIETLAGAHVDVFNLPKVESAAEVKGALETIGRFMPAANIRILANIETPKGIRMAAEIASADACVVGLQLGLADLFMPLLIDRRDLAARQYVRMAVRLAAGEAGIAAYDAAFTEIANPELCREDAEAARSLGFVGKSCIHPSQIAIVNEVFAPRNAEVEHASKVIEAACAAAAEGSQAFVVDGKLIDAPMIAHARAVLAAAGRT